MTAGGGGGGGNKAGVVLLLAVGAYFFFMTDMFSGVVEEEAAAGGAGGAAAPDYEKTVFEKLPAISGEEIQPSDMLTKVILCSNEWDSETKNSVFRSVPPEERKADDMPKFEPADLGQQAWIGLLGTTEGRVYDPHEIDLGLGVNGGSRGGSGIIGGIYVPRGFVVELHVSRSPGTVSSGFRTLTLSEGRYSDLRFDQTLGAIRVFSSGGMFPLKDQGRPSIFAYYYAGKDDSNVSALEIKAAEVDRVPVSPDAERKQNIFDNKSIAVGDTPLRDATTITEENPEGDVLVDDGEVKLPETFRSLRIPAGWYVIAWKDSLPENVMTVTKETHDFQVFYGTDVHDIVWSGGDSVEYGAKYLTFGVSPSLGDYSEHELPFRLTKDRLVTGDFVKDFREKCPPCYVESYRSEDWETGEVTDLSCVHQDSDYITATKPEWAAQQAWDATVMESSDTKSWEGKTAVTRAEAFQDWLKFDIGDDKNFRKYIGCPVDYSGDLITRYKGDVTGGDDEPSGDGSTAGGTDNSTGGEVTGTGGTDQSGNEDYVDPVEEVESGQGVRLLIEYLGSGNAHHRLFPEGTFTWDQVATTMKFYDEEGAKITADSIPQGYRVTVYNVPDPRQEMYTGHAGTKAIVGTGDDDESIRIPRNSGLRIDKFVPNFSIYGHPAGTGEFGGADAPVDKLGWKGTGGNPQPEDDHPRLNRMPSGFRDTFFNLRWFGWQKFRDENDGCPPCYQRVDDKCQHLDSAAVLGEDAGYPQYHPVNEPHGLKWFMPYKEASDLDIVYGPTVYGKDYASEYRSTDNWRTIYDHEPFRNALFYTANDAYVGCDAAGPTLEYIKGGEYPSGSKEYNEAYKGNPGDYSNWGSMQDGYRPDVCLPCYTELYGDGDCYHVSGASHGGGPGTKYAKADLENAAKSIQEGQRSGDISTLGKCGGQNFLECWATGKWDGDTASPPYIGCSVSEQVNTAKQLEIKQFEGVPVKYVEDVEGVMNYGRGRWDDVLWGLKCPPCYLKNQTESTCSYIGAEEHTYNYNQVESSKVEDTALTCDPQLAELSVRINTEGDMHMVPPFGWDAKKQAQFEASFSKVPDQEACPPCYHPKVGDDTNSLCVHNSKDPSIPDVSRGWYKRYPTLDPSVPDTGEYLYGCSATEAKSTYERSALGALTMPVSDDEAFRVYLFNYSDEMKDIWAENIHRPSDSFGNKTLSNFSGDIIRGDVRYLSELAGHSSGYVGAIVPPGVKATFYEYTEFGGASRVVYGPDYVDFEHGGNLRNLIDSVKMEKFDFSSTWPTVPPGSELYTISGKTGINERSGGPNPYPYLSYTGETLV